jgi:hypothetical protein
MDPLEEMARYCLGYGTWEAPYWFIGLEEGMSGTLEDRIKAWQKHGRQTGLSDCKKFHEEIKVYKHHQNSPPLESTWRVLILILLTYLGRKNDEGELKNYQCSQLGMENGETALLELFGLPAKNIEEKLRQKGQHFGKELIKDIHHKRLLAIHEEIRHHKPSLVVMYGTTRKEEFGRLAGKQIEAWNIVQRGATLMTLVPHPTSWGVKNDEWIEHAKKLRACSCRP